MASDNFTFTKLIVGDLEASARFYRDVCGLTELNRITAEVEGRGITEIILTGEPASAATLILFTYHGQPKPEAGDSILGFYTSDLPAFLERARQAGGTVTQEIKSLPEHGLSFAFVTDNEGHVIEALQRL